MRTAGFLILLTKVFFGFGHQISVRLASGAEAGTVVAWGNNHSGQTNIPAGLNSVIAVAAGSEHTVALKSNGTVVAWGDNTYGQTNVPPGLGDVIAIAAGREHCVALKSDGTVLGWGNYNTTGLPNGLSGVVAIAAGAEHTVALKSNGTVVAWGAGTTDTGNYPNHGQSIVPPGLSGVVGISAGGFHTLAVKNDGALAAWGYNGFGQTTIPNGLNGVVAASAGGLHSIAVKTDGTVAAWGRNDVGQTTVPGLLFGVRSVAAGYYHSTALKLDGTVVAWGDNASGQISVPTGLPSSVAVGGGYYHTVVIFGVAPAPVITGQPTNCAANVSADASFAIASTGSSPLRFQWFGLTPSLSGATGSALVAGGFVFDAQVVSGGTGYVQAPTVRFVGGGGSGATATATVSSGAVIALTIVNPGSGYTSPPSVQIDPPNGFLSGQTNATLMLTNVSTNDAGTYFVVITNAYGSVTSSPATLTVNVPVAITQQPLGIITTLGSNVAFTVGASGTMPLSHQWFWQPAMSRTALAVSDVRNGFVVGAAVLYGGGYYSSLPEVQILGGGSGATATATVNNGVVTALNIVSPGSGYPSNAVIQIAPPVAGTTQLLPGQTGATLSLPGVGALASGSYFVVITNAGGSVTSSPALLRVLVPQRFVQSPQRLGDGSFRLLLGAHDGTFLLTNDLADLEVWGSTNVANTNAWLRITNGITVQNGQVQVDDADSAGLMRRFYRVLTK